MKILKNFVIGFTIILAVIFCMIFSLYQYEKHYVNIFDKTNLNMSQTQLENLWGKPDRISKNQNGEKTLFYFTILNDFVFIVDKTQKINLRYKENF